MHFVQVFAILGSFWPPWGVTWETFGRLFPRQFFGPFLEQKVERFWVGPAEGGSPAKRAFACKSLVEIQHALRPLRGAANS